MAIALPTKLNANATDTPCETLTSLDITKYCDPRAVPSDIITPDRSPNSTHMAYAPRPSGISMYARTPCVSAPSANTIPRVASSTATSCLPLAAGGGGLGACGGAGLSVIEGLCSGHWIGVRLDVERPPPPILLLGSVSI